MRGRLFVVALWVALALGLAASAAAQSQTIPIPRVSVGIDAAKSPGEVALSLQILLLLTVLSLAPAILIMMTSFARIVVVLSFVRQALGTQQMPPNQVLIGLALFLTFFVMAPVGQQINAQALQPYLNKEITQSEALEKAAQPLREFMYGQTREKDLALFVGVSRVSRPKARGDLSLRVLIPAFILSELKTAFQIGFLIYIPFLVIDMVIASILLSMGMMMLPPILISLPFKLMLFVLVDGWNLLVGSLVRSFHPAG
ncbi:MAG: flagellar type III secretion system pore protein FliP [Candidatus Tectomicrobia bacterium]|nr:flagellar type III secretion system pore protein FliP [Candidatus Tectomicrobia bacterium]